MNRRLNGRFLLLVIFLVCATASGVFLLHGVQLRRASGSLLVKADQAEKAGDFKRASGELSLYIGLQPDDSEVQARYGLLLESLAESTQDRLRALAILERVLVRHPERDDVRRRVVALAMSPAVDRHEESRGHVELLLRKSPNDGELLEFLGRCDQAAKKYTDAAKSYEAAIRHAPGRTGVYDRLASLLRGPLKAPDRADEIMDARATGRGLIASNPRKHEAYLLRARYRKEYRLPGGDDDVAKALELAPDQADVVLAAADSADARGDDARARDLLRRGLEQHLDDARMIRGLVDLDLKAGRTGEAINLLTGRIDSHPDQDPELRLILAELLIQQGRLGEASPILAHLRKEKGLIPAVLDTLEARINMGRGSHLKAADTLETALVQLEKHPGSSEIVARANLLLAECYERLANPDRRLQAARRALDRTPKDRAARIAFASALIAAGKPDEALEAYRGLAAEIPEVRVVVARLLLRQAVNRPADPNRWTEVERAIDDAERAVPTAEVPLLRAEMLSARGRFDQARDELAQARDQRPDDVAPRIALANLAALQGDQKGALATLDEARSRLGDRIELRLARVALLARLDGEEATRGLVELENAASGLADTDRSRLEDAVGDAYVKLGRLQEAERLWGRVAKARPNDPGIVHKLFDVAASIGDDAAMARGVERLKVIEGQASAPWRVAEATRLALLARRRGDRGGLDRSLILLAEATPIRPGWSRIPLLMAEVLELQGNTDSATESYLKAVKLGEMRPETIRRTVQLLNERGRFVESDRIIQDSLQQGKTGDVTLRLAAEMALRNKDRAKAVEYARRAVAPESGGARDHFWLGQILDRSGQAKDAEGEFRRALALDGTIAEAHLALVRLLAKAGRKHEALAAIEVARDQLKAGEGLRFLAVAYEMVGDRARAEESYRSALAAHPDDTALSLDAVGFFKRSGRPQESLNLLREVSSPRSRASEPQKTFARRSLAIELAALGQGEASREAMRLLDENLRVDPKSVDDRRVRALLLATSPGRRREAIRAFDDIDRKAPASPAEKFLLARLFLEGHEWPKARDLLASLLATDDDNPAYLATYIQALMDYGKANEAAPWLARLAKLAPGEFETVSLTARQLHAAGRSAEAVSLLRKRAEGRDAELLALASLLEEMRQMDAAEDFLKAYRDRSGRAEGVLNLAAFYGRNGQLDQALNLCMDARSSCPTKIVSSACLTILVSAKDKSTAENYDRVAAWLDQAIREDSAEVSLRFDLANLRNMQGDYRESERILRDIIRENPELGGALNNLAWLLAAQRTKADEALSLISRAIDLEGATPDYLDTRAMAHLANGRGDLALVDLEEAIKLQPDASKYFHSAQSHVLIGNVNAAIADMDHAGKDGLTASNIHPIEREAYSRLLDITRSRPVSPVQKGTASSKE